MLIILIIILSLVTILLNIFYAARRASFDKYKGIIEFNAVMISLIIALLAYQGSASDFDNLMKRFGNIISIVEESKETLKSVKESLTYLPEQIDSFSNSIKSLNQVVTHQRDQLENTLEDFSGSIKGFQKSVDDMAKRFDRHPDLSIDLKKVDTDTSVIISDIVITNHGTLLANVYTIRIQIEETGFIAFNLNGWKETPKQLTNLSYQGDKNIFITPEKKFPMLVKCDIQIRKGRKSGMTVFVHYTSPFGNDGSVSKGFAFPN